MTHPRLDDPYDGHASYLADVERELPWVSIRLYADLAVGILAGWAIAYWIYLANWSDSSVAAAKVFAGIGLAMVGFFGAIFFGSLLSDINLGLRHRRTLATIIVLTFATGVVWPMRIRGEQEDASRALHAQAAEDLRQSREQAHRKWVDDVYAAGAHGPLGTEPPMLIVEDDGTSVVVRNIADLAINCVYIVRHLPDGNRGIRLRTGGDDCARLEPGASASYTSKQMPPAYAHGPLEFRIGDPSDPEPTWWSDNALEANYPRELAR